ncbi:ATPase, T2SS/T4P/T4SS family [Halomonas sp. MCCC 1A11057]|uniref:ATPase, T2SS/T4P/T4SS family n=1 Tax=Halomonas sp. MCCC 1A11057 TaxID=2733482 RepID=UPI001F2BF2A4|nr:ATPase, T2SS/T4P/T4SS family [Halomonas sp. MCCC 1A11057]
MKKRYSALFTGNPPPTETTDERSRPYRLLFVDDDPYILSALRRVFHRENYELRFAESAEAALTILESESVELIVSDFKMPGMDGNELLHIVRKRWPHVLRIMLTGYADSEVVLGSMKDGAVYRFNLKPWNDDDLRLTVAMALEQFELRQRRNSAGKGNLRGPELELMELDIPSRNQLLLFLHDQNLINTRQLQRLHGQIHRSQQPAVQIVVDGRWVDEQQLYALLRDEKLCEEIDLREVETDLSLFSILAPSTCMRQWIFPCRREGARLDLAMADPLDIGLIEALTTTTGCTIRPLLCRVEQLMAKLEEAAERYMWLNDTAAEEEDPYEDIEIVLDDSESAENLQQLLTSSVEPPAVRLTNGILLEAVNAGARGILIQPRLDAISVRYRINGIMQDTIQIPSSLLVAVVSRLKLMAELDVAEQQTPQEGHLTVKTPMSILDMTVSTLPTTHGEQVYVRLAPRNSAVFALEQLGLSAEHLRLLRHASARPQGMILSAGPADSGKSMLLHALLRDGPSSSHHISIEQPTQYANDRATQTRPVRDYHDSSADMLDAVLAQHPDVVLLDDHRDSGVIAKAMHTAAYGGKVLTTITASSVADVFARLLTPPADLLTVASGLNAVVMQRLVRRLCEHCRKPVPPTACDALGGPFAQPPIAAWQAMGCHRCHGGYEGRIGLYEVILITDTLRSAIASGRNPWELQALVRSDSPHPLLADAHAKVEQGLTTTEEVLRTLGPQEALPATV